MQSISQSLAVRSWWISC